MSDENDLRLQESDYDFAILHPALRRLYGGTDLYNYGYWRDATGDSTDTLPEASRRLVELHLEMDPKRGFAHSVLDVGCGLGACTAIFAAGYPNAQVTGVNYSARQIAYAEGKYGGPRIAFRQMNAVALDFPDNSFDCIHSVEAAMHFNPRSSFLAEARRLLVPGGRLILTDVLAHRQTTFIPSANGETSIAEYATSLEAADLKTIQIRDIRADTAARFTEVLHANAMHAYGREIDNSISAYLAVLAVNPG